MDIPEFITKNDGSSTGLQQGARQKLLSSG